MSRTPTAVLISGRGSNLKALAAAAQRPDCPFEIALVLSNRPAAPGLAWAGENGLDTLAIDHKAFPTREAFDAEVDTALRRAGIELIALAGFMRIQSAGFVAAWRGRQLNIHPSLLPLFKGLKPQQQALDAGVRLSGCTVHFVTEELDGGPIVAQAAVPVVQGDTATTLEERILAVEHVLYPHALAMVASGRARLAGDQVVIDGETVNQDVHLVSPPLQLPR